MRKYSDIVGIIVIVLSMIIPAILSMVNQSLWIDETTQLSGLTLGSIRVIHWLLGHIDPFYVPSPDKMSPLSHLAGKLWVSMFGLGETPI